MAEEGPPAPKIPLTPKATRANTDQTKAKEPSQKTLQSKNLKNKTLQSKFNH